MNRLLVNPLPMGVRLHAVIDACHSGSLLDLEWKCKVKSSGGDGLVAAVCIAHKPRQESCGSNQGLNPCAAWLRRHSLEAGVHAPALRLQGALSAGARMPQAFSKP